jgi:uncharacterized 2Fe-2S/4Fe-4S cluster protein (DUF4445 family)
MQGFLKVTFQPLGTSVYVPRGETVLAAALEAGVEIHAPCGGIGTCGGCRVVFATKAPAFTPEEAKLLTAAELAAGVRLACRSAIESDAVVSIPETTMRRDSKFLLHGIMREVALRPSVRKIVLDVPRATLDDQRADADRVLAALAALGVRATPERDALAAIPAALRAGSFRVTAVLHDDAILTVEPGDTSATLYAAAFDIGTTTVVGMLLDLLTGREVAVAARTNPQVSYGDDVVSRISFAGADEGLAKLHSAIIGCVNDILAHLCSTAAIHASAIYSIVLCGNTAMNHLFLNVDPTYVAQAPYVAALRSGVDLPASALDVAIHPSGRVTTLPNVAGFVGGDTVAMMLAADYAHDSRLRLAVDIGTNGEIVLGNRDLLLTASAAAGPAFEGARIRHGMRAAAGAVESVRIENGRLVVGTIGDEPAVGLCGTGLIDAVAALLDAGLLDMTGRLFSPGDVETSDDLRARLVQNDVGWQFVVASPERDGAARTVILSQRDIRELQLAKGAIAAGIRILLKEFGITENDLDEVLLAGAFGNYIRKESALRIGLLPPVPPEKITQIGNAAGTGSKLVALDAALRAEADEYSLKARYVELAGRLDFQMIFAEAMLFP